MSRYLVLSCEKRIKDSLLTLKQIIHLLFILGSGSSKKQAKHNAARAMLDKLDGRNQSSSNNQEESEKQQTTSTSTSIPTDSNSSPAGPTTTTATSSSVVTDSSAAITNSSISSENGSKKGAMNSAGNTIGQLQEICVHQGLPMPIYDLETVTGQPHQRSFTMKVQVGVMKATGDGTSKKEAKRDAAAKMIALVKNQNCKDLTEVTKDDEDLAKRVERMKIDTLTPKHSVKIQQFYQNLQDKQCSKLFVLHRTPLKSHQADYKLLLEEVAQEQKFEVTYVEIEDRSDDGKIQCLVQLSTLPVAVCYGTGDSKDSSCQEAARNALNYLKMMTKKSEENGK